MPLGVAQRFAYHIRTEAGATDRAGFDGIELEVPPATHFLDLTIDDQPTTEGVDFSLAASAGAVALHLSHGVPRRQGVSRALSKRGLPALDLFGQPPF